MYLRVGSWFDKAFQGQGVLRELEPFIDTGTVAGIAYELRFENGNEAFRLPPVALT